MLVYILRRIIMMVPTAIGVVTLAFLLMHLSPGDPIEVLLGEHALPADREALREALGLHLPMWEQYIQFISGLIHGDLGNSFYDGRNVVDLILSRLPATANLAFVAIIFALAVAFPLGIWAALYRGKWQDKTALTFSLVGFSMPSFWLGPLLMVVFALWLGVLPVSGSGGAEHIILPAITLGLGMSAFTARLVRSSLLEVLNQDYITTAKAKGVSTTGLIFNHALRNAMLPVITVIFLQAGALLTGAIITETVFSWPGIGSLIVESLQRRDYPLVQGCVLFIACVYMFMTLLSDLFYAVSNPRIRYGESS